MHYYTQRGSDITTWGDALPHPKGIRYHTLRGYVTTSKRDPTPHPKGIRYHIQKGMRYHTQIGSVTSSRRELYHTQRGSVTTPRGEALLSPEEKRHHTHMWNVINPTGLDGKRYHTQRTLYYIQRRPDTKPLRLDAAPRGKPIEHHKVIILHSYSDPIPRPGATVTYWDNPITHCFDSISHTESTQYQT